MEKEETIKAEYYPYPPNSTWEEKEEINKKHIEEWKRYLKPLTKTELTHHNTMTFTEEFEQLLKDSDIMKISGAVGMRTNDDKIAFCLGLEQKEINPEFYTISKLDPSTYLLVNKDESKNDRWVVNFYKKMWYGTNHREIFIK